MESTFPQVLKHGLLGDIICKRERGLDTGLPTKPTSPSYPASNNTHCGGYTTGYLICSCFRP